MSDSELVSKVVCKLVRLVSATVSACVSVLGRSLVCRGLARKVVSVLVRGKVVSWVRELIA